MDPEPPVPAVAAKELRNGRYVLLTPLGQGAQGTTWDAVDKREGRSVAVKAFDIRGARAWKDVELAEREARVLAELRHPGLPRYVEHFEDDGVLYLVMEKVHGTPLSVLKKKGPRMNEKELTRLLHDADQVLTYLHGRNPPIIHRDLKPANVIRRTDGSYAFVDFGAVREHLRSEGGSTVVGTFGYMAPEQFQGRAGPGSDVYAIGATAMAMLTGLEPEKLPHRGLMLDVQAALKGSVGPWLEGALVRMMEPDPDKRATRIGPLLDASRTPGRAAEGAEAARQARPRPVGIRGGAVSNRDERRAGRRAEKESHRRARRDRHREGPFRLPFVIRIVFGMALTIAQIAVILSLQVVVPFLLALLSLLFGDGLRRAADHVRVAGNDVGDALRDARMQVYRGWGTPEDVRVRVEAAANPPMGPRYEPAQRGARVEAPGARATEARSEALEGSDETEDEDDERHRRTSSR